MGEKKIARVEKVESGLQTRASENDALSVISSVRITAEQRFTSFIKGSLHSLTTILYPSACSRETLTGVKSPTHLSFKSHFCHREGWIQNNGVDLRSRCVILLEYVALTAIYLQLTRIYFVGGVIVAHPLTGDMRVILMWVAAAATDTAN